MAGTRPTPSRSGNWTLRARRALERSLPLEHLLPETQPAYVVSWVYVFGAIAIVALIWVIVSGVVLSFFGPQWWHLSSRGRFVNSLHFWSVQVFFVFMVLHLWAQFFAAGWRDGRELTWSVGVVVFAVCIGTAFTGYLSQQDFDAQWIALNAKDAMNSSGIGAYFNVLNFGQMYGLHVMLLPVGVVLLVALHVLLVRMKGVVRPIERGRRS